MRDGARHWPHPWEPEPRWPALIAVFSVVGIYVALPHDIMLRPYWLFPGIVLGLLVPTLITHAHGHHFLNRLFGYLLNCVATVGLIVSVVLLVALLIEKESIHRESPERLLFSAALLWLSNVLIFALWYWRLDAGGPHGRESRAGHPDGAFLFPQMTTAPTPDADSPADLWSPNFIDYLFLAFNTSTAFSPTDAPVLARWAKALTMLQSLISLTVLALLAARAVNTLNPS